MPQQQQQQQQRIQPQQEDEFEQQELTTAYDELYNWYEQSFVPVQSQLIRRRPNQQQQQQHHHHHTSKSTTRQSKKPIFYDEEDDLNDDDIVVSDEDDDELFSGGDSMTSIDGEASMGDAVNHPSGSGKNNLLPGTQCFLEQSVILDDDDPLFATSSSADQLHKQSVNNNTIASPDNKSNNIHIHSNQKGAFSPISRLQRLNITSPFTPTLPRFRMVPSSSPHLGSARRSLLPSTSTSSVLVSSDHKPPPSSTTIEIQETKKQEFTLSYWRVDERVVEEYRKDGVTTLYPWQVAILQLRDVRLGRSNLIYCAPTSGGKTLVTEVLMLRRLTSPQNKGKKAFFIVPFITIVEEKVEQLQRRFRSEGLKAGAYYSSTGGSIRSREFTETQIIVCTIERGNSMIHQLIVAERVDEISMLIIDECHMVGDKSRGYLLESLLTKLVYLNANTQVIGMSATLPNLDQLASWINAELFITNYRPVPLKEYIVIGERIYDTQNEKVNRILPSFPNMQQIVQKNKMIQMLTRQLTGKVGNDLGVMQLCCEVTDQNRSVLIFCRSRFDCNKWGRLIATILKESNRRCSNEIADRRRMMISSLSRTQTGLDPDLEICIQEGVAFHHAGLTKAEREIIERGYREGTIQILTCTTTLSAGVNLPARRVIFASMHIAQDTIDVIRYRQSAGRAGRAGFDEFGESFLIASLKDRNYAFKLTNDFMPDLVSSLSETKKCMSKCLLEAFDGDLVKYGADIGRFVSCTLFKKQVTADVLRNHTKKHLNFLLKHRFIEFDPNEKTYRVSQLGKAANASGFTPEESLFMKLELDNAQSHMILQDDLHIVYHLTPFNHNLPVKWETFCSIFKKLSPIQKKIAAAIGIQEGYLFSMIHGRNAVGYPSTDLPLYTSKQVDKNEIFIQNQEMLLMRFFGALVLRDLIDEMPWSVVAEKYGLHRGQIQALQESSATFSGMVTAFCSALKWKHMKSLFSGLKHRLNFGVKGELVPLCSIPHVKAFIARALFSGGFKTVQAVANATSDQIYKCLKEHIPFRGNSNGDAELGRHYTYMEKMETRRARLIVQGAIKVVETNSILVYDEEEEEEGYEHETFVTISPPPASRIRQQAPEEHELLKRMIEKEDEKREQLNSSNMKEQPLGFHIRKPSIPLRSSVLHRDANHQALITQEVPAAKSVVSPDPPIKRFTPVSVPLKKVGCAQNQQNQSNPRTYRPPLGALSNNTASNNVTLAKQDHYSGAITAFSTTTSDLSTTKRKFSVFEDLNPQQSKKMKSEIGPHPKCLHHNHPYSINVVNPSNQGRMRFLLDSWSKQRVFAFNVTSKPQTKLSGEPVKTIHNITGISICWPSGKFIDQKPVVDIVHHLIITNPLLLGLIKPILENPDTVKISLDMKFNYRILYESGITTPSSNLRDVVVADWILQPSEEEATTNKRKPLSVVFQQIFSVGLIDADNKKNIPDPLTVDSCQTAIHCFRLNIEQEKMMESNGTFHAYERIEMPLVPVLSRLESNGVRFIGKDGDGNSSLVSQWTHLVLAKQDKIAQDIKDYVREKVFPEAATRITGSEFFNSPEKLARLLFDDMQLTYKYKGNSRSTNKEVLDKLHAEYPSIPIFKQIKLWRSLDNLRTKHLRSFCHDFVTLDKKCGFRKIFARQLNTASVTGRLAVTNPNLQNIPHAIEFEHPEPTTDMIRQALSRGQSVPTVSICIRTAFTARDARYILLSADYQQIELRMIAHLSQDQHLMEILKMPGNDPFKSMACHMFGCANVSQVTDDQRKIVKELWYATIYGMGIKTLSSKLSRALNPVDCNSSMHGDIRLQLALKDDLEQAKQYIHQFSQRFPAMDNYRLNTVKQELLNKGYVCTMSGRKRFWDDIPEKQKDEATLESYRRNALSTICQGSAADIFKSAIILTDQIIMEMNKKAPPEEPIAALLMHIHDEIVFEVKRDHLALVGAKIKQSMENAASYFGAELKLPTPVKLKVGENWGQMSDYPIP